MAMDERSLGKRLQAARQTAGLTQQQLCHQANLSFSTLTKIERGAIKSPSIFTIQSIAGALNLSLDELVGQGSGAGRKLRKTSSGVSFIYFDVNGCLVHFFQSAFSSLSEDSGIPADLVETAFWHFNDEGCRGHITLDEFNHKLADRLGLETIDWSKYYLTAVEPIEQMHEVVRWASQYYRVGLLTNILPGLLNGLRQSSKIPQINYDEVIDSSQVGAIKPEAKIYEIATGRANVSPSEILLIDDSRPNLMAAERIGWHVLWFDSTRAEQMSERVKQALQPAD